MGNPKGCHRSNIYEEAHVIFEGRSLPGIFVLNIKMYVNIIWRVKERLIHPIKILKLLVMAHWYLMYES